MVMEMIKSSLHIDYYDELIQYIHSLPERTQLRFLATTALRKTFGVTVIVYDEFSGYVLLAPYIRQPKNKFSEGFINVIENPANAAIRCVQKESGLEVISTPVEIGFDEVKNSKKQSDLFKKYTMLVKGFKGYLRDKVYSKKSMAPVWVSTKLLYYVFESQIHTDMEVHPHLQAFTHFRDILLRQGKDL